MKNIKFNSSKLLFPLVLSGMLAFVSCKNDLDQLEPMRMFTPAGAVRAVSGETDVKLSWNPSLYTTNKNVTYTVEVAKDSLFQTPVVHTVVTDTAGVTLTDEVLTIKERYYARIKANALDQSPESGWATSPRFSIRGEQIFAAINPATIKDKSVVLSWRKINGLTKIVLTPEGGTPQEVMLSPEALEAAEKQLTGLVPNTAYTAEIFAGALSKGIVTFTTKPLSQFTMTVTTADDLVEILEAAANNDVIGLEPGTYDYATINFVIAGKRVTLQSVSGNPANTIINFKEFNIKGTDAGIKLAGLGLDGTNTAGYLINLTGLNADNEAAIFKSIEVDNCNIRNIVNAVFRGNRAANNAHKIDFIRFNNSVVTNSGNGVTWTLFTMDKMEFNRLELVNSTFNTVGRALISWATNISGNPKPTILIDHSTINNFGEAARNNIVVDANANPVDIIIQNSIMANVPRPGNTVGTSFVRASGAGTTLNVTNNNFFNLTNGSGGTVNWPAFAVLQNNKEVDLGWTATTTNFTLPAASELRTASKTGGAIGDPRWTF